MKRIITLIIVIAMLLSTLTSFANEKEVVTNNDKQTTISKKELLDSIKFNKDGTISRLEFLKAVAKLYMPDGVVYKDKESMEIKKYFPDYDYIRYLTDGEIYYYKAPYEYNQYSIRDDYYLYKQNTYDIDVETVKRWVNYYNETINYKEVYELFANLNKDLKKQISNNYGLVLPITKRTFLFDDKIKAKFGSRFEPVKYFSKYLFEKGVITRGNKSYKYDYKVYSKPFITKEDTINFISYIYDNTKEKSTKFKFEEMHSAILFNRKDKIIYTFGNVGYDENLKYAYKVDKIVKVNSAEEFQKYRSEYPVDESTLDYFSIILRTYVPYTPGYVLNGEKYSDSAQTKYENEVFSKLLIHIEYTDVFPDVSKTFRDTMIDVKGNACNNVAGFTLQALRGLKAPLLFKFYDETVKLKTGDIIFERFSHNTMNHIFSINHLGKRIEGSAKNPCIFVSDVGLNVKEYLDEIYNKTKEMIVLLTFDENIGTMTTNNNFGIVSIYEVIDRCIHVFFNNDVNKYIKDVEFYLNIHNIKDIRITNHLKEIKKNFKNTFH